MTLRGFRTGAGLAQRPVVFVELAKAHGNSSTSIHRAHGFLAHPRQIEPNSQIPFAIASVFFSNVCLIDLTTARGSWIWSTATATLSIFPSSWTPRTSGAGQTWSRVTSLTSFTAPWRNKRGTLYYTILYIYMYLIYIYIQIYVYLILWNEVRKRSYAGRFDGVWCENTSIYIYTCYNR